MRISRLHLPHKPEGGDADADRRRKDGPQGSEAGRQGGTGGEDIIDKEDVADVFDVFAGIGSAPLLEGAGY